jgi:CubicO group peptidase (beta-lactamase class C family)
MDAHARRLDPAAARLRAQSVEAGLIQQETGIAAAVVRDREPVYIGCFGMRDREKRLPVSPQTRFALSSATKALTAFVAQQLCAERGTNPDAPVNAPRVLLELHDSNATRELSIADVLAHRSGLPSHDLLWYGDAWGAHDLPARLRFLSPLPDGFRNAFCYSNLMYGCLGTILPDLAGETWEAAVERQVFGPLGMSRSLVGSGAAPESDDVAAPYVGGQRVAAKSAAAIPAAAAWRGSIEDVARWLAVNAADGVTPSGQRGAPPDVFRRMRSPHAKVSEINPLLFMGLEWMSSDVGYGLGWFLGEAAGRRLAFHPGFIDGFSSLLVVVPELRLALAVVTNSNLNPLPGRFCKGLLEAWLGAAVPDVRAATPGPDTPDLPRRIVPDAWRNLAGTYTEPAYGRLQLSANPHRVVYGQQTWPVFLADGPRLGFTVRAFGIEIPLVGEAESVGGRPALRLPLPLDPRVPPPVFRRDAR